MKKLSSFAIIIAFFALSASAQTSKETSGPTKANAGIEDAIVVKQNGPKMVFESETIDYGTIEHNADGVREFKFTNTGDEPLIIQNARGSCGCTVPTWPKESIAPGESNVIKVKYATNRVGSFTKTVTLTTNVEGESKVLTIKGKVLPDAQPEPNTETSPGAGEQ